MVRRQLYVLQRDGEDDRIHIESTEIQAVELVLNESSAQYDSAAA